MHPTPTTRPRHALCWVLGVGLMFVVVVAMALQVARSRADERWGTVLVHFEERILAEVHATRMLDSSWRPETRSGDIFSERRDRILLWPILVLRQERNLFGSTIQAHLSDSVHWGPEEPSVLRVEWVGDIRDILAAVDVELVVEP